MLYKLFEKTNQKKDEFISKVKEQNKQNNDFIDEIMNMIEANSRTEVLENIRKMLTTSEK